VSKVWLVGEHNPYGSSPYFALYPSPPGCAGWRLCKILGMAEDEYIEAFERRNLLSQERWSVPVARKAAADLRRELREDGDALVLLGARVARAFGYDFTPGVVYARQHTNQGPVVEYDVLVTPHPSGLSRQWNDPTMRATVRDAVRALLADRRSVPVEVSGALFSRAQVDALSRHDHGCGAPHLDGRCLAPLGDRARADEHGAPVDRDLRPAHLDERGGEPEGDGGRDDDLA
jgi:hypothetical protein